MRTRAPGALGRLGHSAEWGYVLSLQPTAPQINSAVISYQEKNGGHPSSHLPSIHPLNHERHHTATVTLSHMPHRRRSASASPAWLSLSAADMGPRESVMRDRHRKEGRECTQPLSRQHPHTTLVPSQQSFRLFSSNKSRCFWLGPFPGPAEPHLGNLAPSACAGVWLRWALCPIQRLKSPAHGPHCPLSKSGGAAQRMSR